MGCIYVDREKAAGAKVSCEMDILLFESHHIMICRSMGALTGDGAAREFLDKSRIGW